MSGKTPPAPTDIIGQVYRQESRRVLATLIRLLGDFDLAEEALHDAFRAAVEQWPDEGVPANPRAWLVSTGRFKAIDKLRRSARMNPLSDEAAAQLAAEEQDIAEQLDDRFGDDRLRLIFTCCHPALSADARVALTLREVCGLTTAEIARAFLTAPSTLAQRIVRAKNKIKADHIPYEVPERDALPERLSGVLRVIYLIYNEGYSASSGDTLTRRELSVEAIRLGRLLVRLLPDVEAMGLLALMLLHDSRRQARTSPEGDLILLEEQDRSLWDRSLIAEGTQWMRRALVTRRLGTYTVQAAIAAVHAEADSAMATDWAQIVVLYDILLRMEPSPVIELNRAVAVAMCDGPEAGLRLIEELLAHGELDAYHFAHAARADLCRRSGKHDQARAGYERALELTQLEPERRFLERRLRELDSPR